MRRSILGAALLSVALALPASALAYTSPTWNLNGTYTIAFTCDPSTAECPSPPDYPYSVTITTTSDSSGALTGTGYYIPTGPSGPYTVTLQPGSQVSGWGVTLKLHYDAPGLAGYNPFVLTGTINQNGGMSGTAVDAGNGSAPRTFDWGTTSGSVGLFSPRCEYGTYAGYEMLNSGFAPGTGEAVSWTGLDPNRVYFVEASGTYFAGGNGLFDIQADAKYSQDAAQRAVNGAWTDSVNGYGYLGSTLLDLFVNGNPVAWGAYNAGHRYTANIAGFTTVAIAANIYDTFPSNNTGGLCVALFAKTLYSFDGFYAPVDNLPALNVAKAGSAIPVKFSLDGDQGLDIFWAGYPTSRVIACDSTAIADAVEETVTAGGSSLVYDPVADQYVYVWKTSKTWANTCRQLVVRLDDGSLHVANFKFK